MDTPPAGIKRRDGRLNYYLVHLYFCVTGINKTTDAVTLTYDPWGSACLDDAVGEQECQGRRVVADREGVGADNGGGDSGEVVG